MSDFPRGWTLSQFIAGAASIAVPAIAGVVHVLDSFDFKFVTGANAGATLLSLSSSDGVFAALSLGVTSAQANSTDSAAGSNLDLAAGPGASLTVSCGALPVGAEVLLVIQGHDI